MTQQSKSGQSQQGTPDPQALAQAAQLVSDAQAAGLDFGSIFKMISVLQKHSGLLVGIGALIADLSKVVTGGSGFQAGQSSSSSQP